MRLTLGRNLSVTATERWLSEVRAGRAFVRGTYFGPAAGNNGHIQLFNPVGSLVNVVVRSLLLATNPAGVLNMAVYNTALGTLIGAGVNLLSGGAAGSAEVRTGSNVGVLGTLVGQYRVALDTPIYPSPEWFFELGAGEGVLVTSVNTDFNLSAVFTWIEV